MDILRDENGWDGKLYGTGMDRTGIDVILDGEGWNVTG